MFYRLVWQYLLCWYYCRRVLVVLVVGLCPTMVPRATTVSVSIGSFRLYSAWTSGQSMFGLIPPVCWSGPPIVRGLPLFFTYTALMVSTHTHTETYVLPSSFTLYFPSCRCVVPVSGTFLDDRRRNGQRHSTAQVCFNFWSLSPCIWKINLLASPCFLCAGVCWRAVEAGLCYWRRRLSGWSWRALTMYWI